MHVAKMYPVSHKFSLVAQWLRNVFLEYLLEWENEAYSKPGHTHAQQEDMLLSKETREGLKITGMFCDHCCTAMCVCV